MVRLHRVIHRFLEVREVRLAMGCLAGRVVLRCLLVLVHQVVRVGLKSALIILCKFMQVWCDLTWRSVRASTTATVLKLALVAIFKVIANRITQICLSQSCG